MCGRDVPSDMDEEVSGGIAQELHSEVGRSRPGVCVPITSIHIAISWTQGWGKRERERGRERERERERESCIIVEVTCLTSHTQAHRHNSMGTMHARLFNLILYHCTTAIVKSLTAGLAADLVRNSCI